MCGIAGLFATKDTSTIVRQDVEQMTRALAHRGPDGEGFYVNERVAFGHRRLAIVDIEGGVQPMADEEGKAVLTFNGEIYNAADIRTELVALGHKFLTSHSDTEVLLRGYLEWGLDIVKRLQGMFAFAIWDNHLNRLFLVRDRLGIKPLYYSLMSDGNLAFASELKGLLGYPALEKTLNFEALEDYLTLSYVPDPKTILDGVYKLEAGQYLTFTRGQKAPELTPYWDADFAAETEVHSAQNELVERLSAAVKARMIADVPLGGFLSGGVDSSAIISIMASLSPQTIKSFSIGFNDPDFDETIFAEQVAELYKTDHKMRIASMDCQDQIDRMIEIFDEPFADSSAIATLKLCRTAREDVKVALSGDGSDEIFAGYRRHKFHLAEHRLRRIIPLAIRRPLFGLLGKIYPKFDFLPRFLRAKSTFEGLALSSAEAYCHSVSRTPSREMSRLRTKAFSRHTKGYKTSQLFDKYYKKAAASDELSRIQYIDLKTFLAGGMMTKVDRTSMAVGLEVRVPFLDHRFVDWVTKIPAHMRITEKGQKAVLKKALEQYLPPEILYREKQGFSVPMASWLRDELREEVENLDQAPALIDRAQLSAKGIKAMADEHLSGIRDHHETLWCLLVLNRSLNRIFA